MSYRTLPTAWWEVETDNPGTTREVLVDDDRPIPTGVLDPSGQMIFRVKQRQRIGFHFS